ncbi:transketolase [Polynucleobacter sp. JS-JIR-5-A7]|uniref:transketolase n=1 Tax=Polynucleobacter sp. JS-JIR-5-A7 TaxID=1758395 RepID=UPI00203A6C72|nr:transketolase [Polynucleobacter sp. JS-JIR-5-A7]
MANRIRQNSLKMVHRAKASHIASALSISDILAVLYGVVMKYDRLDQYNPDRDRFILSKGHSCVAVYSTLAEVGFLSIDDLVTYGEDFSWLMNHISHKVNGVEFSTGSLGHGLPFGVGKALAAKARNRPWKTFVLLSDGEMDEGSNWEALMFASHHKLSGLTAIIDYNKLQSLGTVSSTLAIEPFSDKLKAFGWSVREIDGHNHQEIIQSLVNVPDDKPLAIIAHTIKGKGVSFMENKVEWHYKNPNDEQLELALSELRLAYA